MTPETITALLQYGALGVVVMLFVFFGGVGSVLVYVSVSAIQ